MKRYSLGVLAATLLCASAHAAPPTPDADAHRATLADHAALVAAKEAQKKPLPRLAPQFAPRRLSVGASFRVSDSTQAYPPESGIKMLAGGGATVSCFDDAPNTACTFTSPSGTVTTITPGNGILSTQSPLISAGTLSIDTTVVATLSGTQTLTNKTLSGGSNSFSNIGNGALTNSAIGVVAGTGLAGGGTPSLGGTTTLSIDATVATLTGTQTLTGKTISGGSNTLSNIAQSSVTGLTGALAALVPLTRNINTSSPLAGGGALSADLTLTCSTCIVSGGSYADPSWITSLAGSKISGAVANATSAVNFTGSLVGVVSGTQGATAIANGNVTNSMLANPSIVVTTASPLGGAATVSLGGTLALTCTTCVTTARQVLAGAGLSGGGALSSDVTLSLALTIDGTLGGAGTSGSALGLALGHANTWTATQTFPSASITNAELVNPSITVTTASPLGGAGTIALGGTLALTCTSCVTQAYTTVKNSAGTAQTQRSNLKFGSDFAVADSSPDTTLALANNSVTVSTSSPLGGGGSLALGGSLTLTCSTCTTAGTGAAGDLVYATGTGVALTRLAVGTSSQVLIGGTVPAWGAVPPSAIPSTTVTAGSYTLASITVGADGRLTAASSGSGGGGAYATIQSPPGTSLTQRTVLSVDGTELVAADNSGATRTDLTIGSGITRNASTQTLTNKTLTAPILNGWTATGSSNFDLTGSTGLLLANSITLENTINQIKFQAPATGHQIIMSATSPAGTTSTVMIPDVGSADTFVFNSLAAALSNKTISGASNTLSNIANASLSNSSITVSTATPLGGAATVSLGGTLALTCTTCLNGTPTTTGDLLYSTSGTAALSPLHPVASGSYLVSAGTAAAPAWSTLTLPNAATTGDVLIATGTNAVGRLAAVASGSVLTSAGTGTAPVWAAPSLAAAPFCDNSAFIKGLITKYGGSTGTSGDYAEGAVFSFDTAAHVTGIKWYQPAGITHALTVALWDQHAGTSLGTVAVSAPTANAVNTATFATSISLVAGQQVSLTIRDTVNQLLYTASIGGGNVYSCMPNGGGALSGVGVFWGPHLWLDGIGYHGAGGNGVIDTFGSYNGIIPTWTIP